LAKFLHLLILYDDKFKKKLSEIKESYIELYTLEAIITTSFSPAALQHFSPKGNSHFQSEKNIE
jgi:hypothetical protein